MAILIKLTSKGEQFDEVGGGRLVFFDLKELTRRMSFPWEN